MWVRSLGWEGALEEGVAPTFLPGDSPQTELPGGLTVHRVVADRFLFRLQGTAHTLTPPPGSLPVCAELFLSSFLEASYHPDWERGGALFAILLHREGNQGSGGA